MTTSALTSLSDQFLIAMPSMRDPHFARTVTYIFDHNEQGAMGLIVNRPLEMHLDEILGHMDMSQPRPLKRNPPIFIGGPVKTERGFVLHRNTEREWQSSFRINDQLSLTTSVDVLEAIAQDQGPTDYLIALGYSGWSEGQLEHELAENAWLTCKADYRILFNTPVEQRLDAAARSIGVDLTLLSTQAGHG
ncbi:hypothetical protein WH50_20660 [Pokkaliibacter plantistimulans]|uniref:UPF0301 protein WH50_20660 n=2 Tax=Pseudomonadota TaxID=1224 RepID=A0ABX5LS34_9GAMM|nr:MULTISPECIES: YqgE/AlgH family protein [Pokkaliibacter]MDH2432755.1 YqgE/AlgH family protein [Pokkaliibacter sp. MBI-7]PPC78340.1 YqgE/AlgH family protein [Pokkaliibacter plantistimulans]PXF29454.1 hypothetical protein WH50_20660 [Pokkaliibacter plantistimulans]